MMVERNVEKWFCKGTRHKKCNPLDRALYARNSLMSEALVWLEITGDMKSI